MILIKTEIMDYGRVRILKFKIDGHARLAYLKISVDENYKDFLDRIQPGKILVSEKAQLERQVLDEN